MTTNRLYSIAVYSLIPLLLGWSILPAAAEAPKEEVINGTEMVKEVSPSGESKLPDGLYDRDKLDRTNMPKPEDNFWDELARCETGTNWQDPGRFGGGLGIMNTGTFAKGVLGRGQMGTWERWGGEEFAPTPQEATREEQIVVANRIAVWGWATTVDRGQEFAERHGVGRIYDYNKKPVGFYGWGALGCAGGKPKKLYYHDNPDKLMLIKYEWMEQSVAVRDLQVLMGMKSPTGVYDEATRTKHIEGLQYWGLTMAGVPEVPVMSEDIVLMILNRVNEVLWWT